MGFCKVLIYHVLCHFANRRTKFIRINDETLISPPFRHKKMAEPKLNTAIKKQVPTVIIEPFQISAESSESAKSSGNFRLRFDFFPKTG